ncbi:hypothetical protein CIHG_07949 [Coccidioides immitis H538.4]|uniref:Uncharacterized protein n=1 Tax=Coccidioides immitis H538.4 TaxID=396776 RepID=A0A0J8RYB8_COCIT|nr:hypothetical protein CIHG_07949 [Coccidioides immitis H538.4]
MALSDKFAADPLYPHKLESTSNSQIASSATSYRLWILVETAFEERQIQRGRLANEIRSMTAQPVSGERNYIERFLAILMDLDRIGFPYHSHILHDIFKDNTTPRWREFMQTPLEMAYREGSDLPEQELNSLLQDISYRIRKQGESMRRSPAKTNKNSTRVQIRARIRIERLRRTQFSSNLVGLYVDLSSKKVFTIRRSTQLLISNDVGMLYHKRRPLYLTVHVDDCYIMGPDGSEIDWLLKMLQHRFEMKKVTSQSHFLGMQAQKAKWRSLC